MNIKSCILVFTLKNNKTLTQENGNAAEIQTVDFPNTSLQQCHSSILSVLKE
jgi:hypothetical protein